MFRHILCPVDFSANAEPAIEHAIAWAEGRACSLELLHVLPHAVYAMPELTSLTAELDAQLLADLEAKMAAQLARVRTRVPGAEGRVVRGEPAPTIVAHARAVGADLIVLATDGHGALARAVLGSVADRVLRTSPAPVLLVPKEGRPVSRLPKGIVAPTDFSRPSRGAIERARAMADELGAHVDVVHSYDVPRFVERDPATRERFRAAMAEEMREENAELAGHANLTLHAREGSPAAAIVALGEERAADLVVIAATGRGLLSSLLLGGVTERLARTSPIPVLVVRPPV